MYEEADGIAVVLIPKTTLDHTGQYEVVASNCAGMAKCVAFLSVEPHLPPRPIIPVEPSAPPVFKKCLQHATVDAGTSAQFEAEVIGKPQPSVSYLASFKDGILSSVCGDRTLWAWTVDDLLISKNMYKCLRLNQQILDSDSDTSDNYCEENMQSYPAEQSFVDMCSTLSLSPTNIKDAQVSICSNSILPSTCSRSTLKYFDKDQNSAKLSDLYNVIDFQEKLLNLSEKQVKYNSAKTSGRLKNYKIYKQFFEAETKSVKFAKLTSLNSKKSGTTRKLCSVATTDVSLPFKIDTKVSSNYDNEARKLTSTYHYNPWVIEIKKWKGMKSENLCKFNSNSDALVETRLQSLNTSSTNAFKSTGKLKIHSNLLPIIEEEEEYDSNEANSSKRINFLKKIEQDNLERNEGLELNLSHKLETAKEASCHSVRRFKSSNEPNVKGNVPIESSIKTIDTNRLLSFRYRCLNTDENQKSYFSSNTTYSYVVRLNFEYSSKEMQELIVHDLLTFQSSTQAFSVYIFSLTDNDYLSNHALTPFSTSTCSNYLYHFYYNFLFPHETKTIDEIKFPPGFFLVYVMCFKDGI